MSQNVKKSHDEDELQVILCSMTEKFKSLQSFDCDIIFDEDITDIQKIVDIISDRLQKESNIAN